MDALTLSSDAKQVIKDWKSVLWVNCTTDGGGGGGWEGVCVYVCVCVCVCVGGMAY